MALSRMDFFPAFVQKRNKLRGTPHYSIALSTGIPIVVLIAVRGDIIILGDMYAFGLLGAFTLTCLGLDIIRHRERKTARLLAAQTSTTNTNDNSQEPHSTDAAYRIESSPDNLRNNGSSITGGLELENVRLLSS